MPEVGQPWRSWGGFRRWTRCAVTLQSVQSHSCVCLQLLRMCWYMLIYFSVVTPCWSARVVSREPPRVLSPGQGLLVGREVIVTRTQRAKLYLGIPFAEPPLNDLRFAPPKFKPLPSWDDARNATNFQSACMQLRDKFVEHDRLKLASKLFPDEDIRFSEDCLYLNVYTPDGEYHNICTSLEILCKDYKYIIL